MGRGRGTTSAGSSLNKSRVEAIGEKSISEQLAYYSGHSNILEQNTDGERKSGAIKAKFSFYGSGKGTTINDAYISEYHYDSFAKEMYEKLIESADENLHEVKEYSKVKSRDDISELSYDEKVLAARKHYFEKEKDAWVSPKHSIEAINGDDKFKRKDLRTWKRPRMLEEDLVKRILNGKENDWDQKVLETIIASKNIAPQDFIITVENDYYGDEEGPVLLKKDIWQEINESFESYLNDSDGDLADAHLWLTSHNLSSIELG